MLCGVSDLVLLHIFLIKEKTSGIVKTQPSLPLFKFAVAGNGVIVTMLVPASTVSFLTVITGRCLMSAQTFLFTCVFCSSVLKHLNSLWQRLCFFHVFEQCSTPPMKDIACYISADDRLTWHFFALYISLSRTQQTVLFFQRLLLSNSGTTGGKHRQMVSLAPHFTSSLSYPCHIEIIMQFSLLSSLSNLYFSYK